MLFFDECFSAAIQSSKHVICRLNMFIGEVFQTFSRDMSVRLEVKDMAL